MDLLKERLLKAVSYARETDWEIFERPDKIIRRLKKAKNVCAFGAGNFYLENLIWLPEINELCNYVCDNNLEKWNKEIAGRRCISPAELKQLEDVVVIISMGDYRAVEQQLNTMNIECYPLESLILRTCDNVHYKHDFFEQKEEEIISVLEILSDDFSKELFVEDICLKIAPHLAKKIYCDLKSSGQKQYFQTDVLALNRQEAFVDAGAYNGDSILEFLEAVDHKFQAIYAFELEDKNFLELLSTVEKTNLPGIECCHAGVSDKNTECSISGGGYGWRINEVGKGNTKLVRLDDALNSKTITFIKMDVEGSEMNALYGCNKILKTQHPKLAICTYHKLSHIWEIPRYIKSIDHRYEIYLRHHSDTVWDTVCYAFIKENLEK